MEEQENGIRTVYKTGTGELVEKKSRFLSFVYGVKSEEEAALILEDLKKKYWDARHVCYACVLGERGERRRFSDDGEPSQTAGKPLLDVLMGAGLTDTLVVVVRYFGGVLLGTGGLVRAYSGAAEDALKNAVVIVKQAARELTVTIDYTAFGKVQYLLNQEDIVIRQTQYADQVILTMPVPLGKYDALRAKITDATNGAAKLENGDNVQFAVVDRQAVYF